MYDWLPGALDGTSTVITANRRLARVLKQEFARRQVEAGVLAWPSPRILAWPDWLDAQLREASRQEHLPTRINAYHSALLWDRCLRRELGEDAVGVANLVRLARDSWQRLSDWDVSIRDVARASLSSDHKAFAAAAGRYAGLLERESWIDDAGLAAHVAKLIADGDIAAAGRYTFAGFDREKPSAARIRVHLAKAGCAVVDVPVPVRADQPVLVPFATADGELRAAGTWARKRLEEDPEHHIAIVANGLERDAPRMAGLVREGLMPGYRLSPTHLADALNVSYGRKLASYPLISIGLLWLRWLVRDLRATEVSQLLRSPLVVAGPGSGRAQLELRLRRLPDRNWSPSMITSALQGKDESADSAEWLQRVAAVTKNRRDLGGAASPAHWAVTIDEILKAAGWPGKQGLRSAEFQLVNRWRDLLNDLARMDLVSSRMSLETALNQLESMAADAVFQPESEHARVHLMGPLEASGLEFDALWLTGVTAGHWPPAGNPSALVSRRLQEQHGMPDATPDDTVASNFEGAGNFYDNISFCARGGGGGGPGIELRPLPEIYTTGKAINYGPYRAGGPGSGEFPTDAQILEDLGLLQTAGYNLIRLFGADALHERILQLAEANFPELRFQQGLNLEGLSGDAATNCDRASNDSQVATAIQLANDYPNVATVSVGNETSFFAPFMPLNCLEGYITETRDNVTQPVTADDDYTFYANFFGRSPDEVLRRIDFVSIHTYPFLNYQQWDWRQEAVPAGPLRAEAMMNASLAKAQDNYQAVYDYRYRNASGVTVTVGETRPIVIGETGWKWRQTAPTQEIETYAANPVNAKWYKDLMASWERSPGGPVTVVDFVAFDEAWKLTDDGWGFWDELRQPNYALCDTPAAGAPCNNPVYQGAGFFTP